MLKINGWHYWVGRDKKIHFTLTGKTPVSLSDGFKVSGKGFLMDLENVVQHRPNVQIEYLPDPEGE